MSVFIIILLISELKGVKPMATISVSGKQKKHLFSVFNPKGNFTLPKCGGVYFIVECNSNPYGLSMDYIKGMGTCANFEQHFQNHPLVRNESEKQSSFIYLLPEINDQIRLDTLKDLESCFKSEMTNQRNSLVSEMSIGVENLNRFLKKPSKEAKNTRSKKA